MKISTLYDIPHKIKNKRLAAFIYKINKMIVNVLYPKIVGLSYGIDKTSKVIVSLTSFPDRIDTVWITIATMLNQTFKPGEIILWLAKEQFPGGEKDLPQELIKLKRYGLTIRFCDDLCSHKKYYYSMLENPERIVITVDDDVFYPEYLIEELIHASERYPGVICCTWAHMITLDQGGFIEPYEKWIHGVKICDRPDIRIMPVGIGGVLYPPNCFDDRVFDKNSIRSLCLKADDLWLKAMAILNDTPAVRITKKYDWTFFTIAKTQKTGLRYENVIDNKNDDIFKRIIGIHQEIPKILQMGEKIASESEGI